MPVRFEVMCSAIFVMQHFFPPPFLYLLLVLQKKINYFKVSKYLEDSVKNKGYFFKTIIMNILIVECFLNVCYRKAFHMFLKGLSLEPNYVKIFFFNSEQFHQHYLRPKAIFIREKKMFFISSNDNMCTQISTELKVKSCDTASRVT